MPITATAVQTPVLTRDDIRGFLRDVGAQIPGTGVLSTLLDGPEFSDADIERAIKFTVARYNAITPITRIDPNSINPWVLLVGACAFLMQSEGFRQLRNQVTAQDGDVAPIGMDDKQALYNQVSQLCADEFKTMARGIKTQLNMEEAYGSLGSGYRSVSRFHHY